MLVTQGLIKRLGIACGICKGYIYRQNRCLINVNSRVSRTHESKLKEEMTWENNYIAKSRATEREQANSLTHTRLSWLVLLVP